MKSCTFNNTSKEQPTRLCKVHCPPPKRCHSLMKKYFVMFETGRPDAKPSSAQLLAAELHVSWSVCHCPK